MSKKLLPLIFALAFAFAGCLGISGDEEPEPVDDNGNGSDDPANGDGDHGNGDGDDGNGDGDNGTENETTNSPPTASLEADLTSGEAPMNVTFSLDGSDPDGDGLTWSLDFGDGSDIVEGETLPIEQEHTFTEAGNFTVTLVVDDGTETSNQTVVISVTEPTGPIQTHSGGWTLTTPVYCAIAGAVFTELNGILTEGIAVDPETIGHSFTATFASEVEAAIVEYSVHFIDTSSGFDIIRSFSGDPGDSITGEVPEGSDEVFFSACGVSGPVDVEYSV